MKYIYKFLVDLNGLSVANVKVGKSVKKYEVWCQIEDMDTPPYVFKWKSTK